MVRRVGLTGGIACGKSFVAELFRARGVAVINDDDAARDAVAVGTPGLAAVVAAFGPGILLPDGNLDRPALGRIVFADPTRRAELMALTFPYIGRLLGERLAAAELAAAAQATGDTTGAVPTPLVVYESALLVENGQADAWRPLVVVTTTRDRQLARLCQRNGLTEQEARDRIASQLAADEKARLADHLIVTSGSHEDTAQQFERVLERLRAPLPS